MSVEKLYQSLQEKPFLISGPCVIESEAMCVDLAGEIKEIADELGFVYVFKASFDKANRTSVSSHRGPGLEEGLKVLEKVKKEIGVPVTTDVHESSQVAAAAEVIDIIQIPAFLCRQTDLLVESAKSGKIVNIKKAQFLAGESMVHPAEKVIASGNNKVMLTERGTAFGPGNLVVDFRNLVDMQKFGYPVVMDVTHSCQKPGGGATTAGNREYAPHFANAAAAVGVRGFFFETHRDPSQALSDGPNMVPLHELKAVLKRVQQHFID